MDLPEDKHPDLGLCRHALLSLSCRGTRQLVIFMDDFHKLLLILVNKIPPASG
jgi:hypothetical protein